MAEFKGDEWVDPNDKVNGINRGNEWTPYVDGMSVYDANKIVSNLIYLKKKLDELTSGGN